MKRILTILLTFISLSVMAQSPALQQGGKIRIMQGGAPQLIVDPVPSSYVAQYESVYNSFSVKPSDSIADAQNKFVKTLVDSSIWDELIAGDLFLVYASHDSTAALVNWANPDSSAESINNATWQDKVGYSSNGSNSYINTHHNLFSESTNYYKDSCSIILYSWTDQNSFAYSFGSIDLNGITQSRIYHTTLLKSIWNINGNQGTTSTTLDSSNALFTAIRYNGSLVITYQDTTLIDSITDASSTGIPQIDMFTCARNNSGTADNFDTRQLGLYAAIGKLTRQQQIIFKEAWYTYLEDIENISTLLASQESEGEDQSEFGPLWADSETWENNLKWKE